jgi:hypothetical protein
LTKASSQQMSSRGRSRRLSRRNFILSVAASFGRVRGCQSLGMALGGCGVKHRVRSREGKAPLSRETNNSEPLLPLGWASSRFLQLAGVAVQSHRSLARRSGRDKVQSGFGVLDLSWSLLCPAATTAFHLLPPSVLSQPVFLNWRNPCPLTGS